MTLSLHDGALIVLTLLALVGAISDVRHRILPNRLSLMIAAAGIGWSVLASTAAAPWYLYCAHGFLALVLGMALFRFGVFGGGDAKFYAALAFWLPLTKAPLLLTAIALAGLVVLIVWFAARRIRGKPVANTNAARDGKLPYGVAIALGAVIAFAM